MPSVVSQLRRGVRLCGVLYVHTLYKEMNSVASCSPSGSELSRPAGTNHVLIENLSPHYIQKHHLDFCNRPGFRL